MTTCPPCKHDCDHPCEEYLTGQMTTSWQRNDERWADIVKHLAERGLSDAHAEIAADYIIECLDLQEKYFESQREPHS